MSKNSSNEAFARSIAYITPPNDVMQNHLGTSNYLFADGHVKALKPLVTGTPYNMWLTSNPTGAAAPTSLLSVLAAQQELMK